MPCSTGELCQIPNRSLGSNQGYLCRGGCGGQLHGLCGEQEQEGNGELQRLCPTCASKRSAEAASKAASSKRKAQENATSKSQRTKCGEGKKSDRSASRTQLSLPQEMAMLVDLDKGMCQETVAERYKCGVRTIQSIKPNKENTVKQAKTARGSRKSNCPGEFLEVGFIGVTSGPRTS